MKKYIVLFLAPALILCLAIAGPSGNAQASSEGLSVDEMNGQEGFSSEKEYTESPQKKETGQPQKPEGGILLSGDCSDYEDLSELPLPISVSGSTVGATNDYGPFPLRPACWMGDWYELSSDGPDVTYKWTVPADGAYTISLCESSYDTSLELYDFTCPSEPRYPDNYICGNDDACALQSELPCIALAEGQEILIVVDGYANNAGNYLLAISQCGEPPSNDDCSGYADLTGQSLPIFVSGTTLGAANDYGPFPSTPGCWQGIWLDGAASASDVTYKWTAPASGYYTLEVCNSDYDSDILLYNFTCPNEPIYPDDFICGTDWGFCPIWGGGPYSGGLQSILLEEGQEVLVVVDGYQLFAGNFELAIYESEPPPPPFECPENTIFGQPASTPLDPFRPSTSDLHMVWKVYDNLSDLSGAICQVSFWGFDWYYSNGWHECEEEPMTFLIRFYEDDGGYPGALVCSRTITPTRTPTGVIYVGSELNYYEGVLDPCCEVDGGWISIYGTSYGGDPGNCTFIWLDSQEGDDLCYQWDGSQFLDRESSRSLCLGEEPTGYEYLPGDCNMALGIWPPDVVGGDVTYLVDYFIGQGNAPCKLDDFWASADVTGDCMIIGGDVSALVGYLIGTIPAILYCPDYEPAWLEGIPDDPPDGWPNCDTPVINSKVIPTGLVE